jgi:hypothetical protein
MGQYSGFVMFCAIILISNLLNQCMPIARIKGAQVWDFDLLDSNDFFIIKSL